MSGLCEWHMHFSCLFCFFVKVRQWHVSIRDRSSQSERQVWSFLSMRCLRCPRCNGCKYDVHHKGFLFDYISWLACTILSPYLDGRLGAAVRQLTRIICEILDTGSSTLNMFGICLRYLERYQVSAWLAYAAPMAEQYSCNVEGFAM